MSAKVKQQNYQGAFRTSARQCVEIFARSALARRRVRSLGTIEYVIRRRQVLEDYAVNLILDVGANVGQFARDLRRCYKGELISFEPVSASFKILAGTAARDPRWRVCQSALGSQTSSQTMNVYRGTELSSFLRANSYCAKKFGEDETTMQREVVSVRRLDEVLDEIVPDCQEKRIFLKMDTQGYDLEVFNGLGKKLERVVAIQSEVSLIPLYEGMPHWTDSISFYERAGFGVVGLFPLTSEGCRVIEYDCLMVRI
jgi:FkbM family methyltransferase